MGGKPCVRGMRVAVSAIVGLIAEGRSEQDVLRMYPYVAPADISQALSDAAWRLQET